MHDAQRIPVNELRIEERMEELRVYPASVSSLMVDNPSFRLFVCFLASRVPSKGWQTAIPEDVVAFLIHRETSGRTAVHKPDCPHVGARVAVDCHCETRMALKSLKNVRSSLHQAYVLLGVREGWQAATGLGDPTMAPLVNLFFAKVAKEYAEGQVTPHQATPMLSDKLAILVVKLRLWSNFRDGPLRKSDAVDFIYLQDRFLYTALMQVGSRGRDIMRVRMSAVRKSERDGRQVLLLNCLWTKTLRTSANELFFLVADRGNPAVCPVEAFQAYLRAMQKYSKGVSLATAFLFPRVAKGDLVLDTAMEPAQASYRLRKYLDAIGMDQGETLHGFRSGAALEALLNGASAEGTMEKIGWRTKDSLLWYTKLDRVLGDGARVTNVDFGQRNITSAAHRGMDMLLATNPVISE
jgi:hypothetical protein